MPYGINNDDVAIMKSPPSPNNSGRQEKFEDQPGKSSQDKPVDQVGLQAALSIAAKRYRWLTDNVYDLVYCVDEFGTITSVNKAVTRYGFSDGELIGENLFDMIHIEDRDQVMNDFFEIFTNRESRVHVHRFRFRAKAGTHHWFEAHVSSEFGPDGRFLFMESVCRDITESMKNEAASNKIRDELKELVKARTTELTLANDGLQKEILQRRETERILREREAYLRLEKGNLQETNTALKVLIKRREVDKHAFEEQVMHNVKEFVLPYLDKLKNLSVDERQNAYLSILEANLSDITSPFSRRLSLDYFDLTPSERKTANFIRQGKRTRDIAALLGLSVRTVEAYRFNIRKKLRLLNTKVNLRTFLLSISE